MNGPPRRRAGAPQGARAGARSWGARSWGASRGHGDPQHAAPFRPAVRPVAAAPVASRAGAGGVLLARPSWPPLTRSPPALRPNGRRRLMAGPGPGVRAPACKATTARSGRRPQCCNRVTRPGDGRVTRGHGAGMAGTRGARAMRAHGQQAAGAKSAGRVRGSPARTPGTGATDPHPPANAVTIAPARPPPRHARAPARGAPRRRACSVS